MADYQEQVNNYEGETSIQQVDSLTGPADLRAQLEAAAAPLEYQASLETKFASYDNYCSLFHYILNSEGPVDIEQPSYYWAWDVIDEFIYQFESFCRYRNRVARTNPGDEEAGILRENPNTWGCYSVLNVLYSLIQRSPKSTNSSPPRSAGEDPNPGRGRIRLTRPHLPHARLLLHHRPPPSPLPPRRLQSLALKTLGRYRDEQESHVRPRHGRPPQHLLLRRLLLHDAPPLRRRRPHVLPHPRLCLSYQELPEGWKPAIRCYREEDGTDVCSHRHLCLIRTHSSRRHHSHRPPREVR